MTTLSARLRIEARADLEPDAPHSQTIGHTLENTPGGRGWRNGSGAGEANRVYLEEAELTAGASRVYDLSAGGGLVDVLGQAIDADRLKAICLRCLSGELAMDGAGGNHIDLFEQNTHGILLKPGQSFAADLGADGIDVTTHPLFRIEEKGGAPASYLLWFIVAQ